MKLWGNLTKKRSVLIILELDLILQYLMKMCLILRTSRMRDYVTVTLAWFMDKIVSMSIQKQKLKFSCLRFIIISNRTFRNNGEWRNFLEKYSLKTVSKVIDFYHICLKNCRASHFIYRKLWISRSANIFEILIRGKNLWSRIKNYKVEERRNRCKK